MPVLPRICSTKGHVEGQIVGAPLKHQGLVCTFRRPRTNYNLRTRCNLCTGDDTAACRLGKQRQRQVINLKILWTLEQDVARREDLMHQTSEDSKIRRNSVHQSIYLYYSICKTTVPCVTPPITNLGF
jgi:hypothetical protein